MRRKLNLYYVPRPVAFGNQQLVYKRLVPWRPDPVFDKTAKLSDYIVSWVTQDKILAYETTKSESRAEMIYKIAIPIGLMVLAALIWILMPTILEKIASYGIPRADSQLEMFKDILKGAP